MEVIRIDYLHVQENLPKSSCCIGFFDGLHTGHQALLENCIAKAKELNIQSGLITFDPDPWKIFFRTVYVVISQRQKIVYTWQA